MGDVDVDDPNSEHREYDKFAAYGASKTANILHAKEADRRLCELGIRAYAVHPGTVATSLARYMSKSDFSQFANMPSRAEPHVANTPTATSTSPRRVGSATQVWAAVSPELADRGGLYLESCGVSDALDPTRTTPSTPRSCGRSPRSFVRQRDREWNGASRRSARRFSRPRRPLPRPGVNATKIDQICQRADVANRTFFDHFATRQA